MSVIQAPSALAATTGSGELAGETGCGRRMDDVAAVGDGVEPERVSVGGGYLDSVGEQLEQACARLFAERGWVVGDGAVVEYRERGVEVIEPRIDQFEADNRHLDGGSDL